MPDVPEHRYRGARAMVVLHERHLRSCIDVWKRFAASGRSLPATSDPDYASSSALLRHLVACARGYMFWCCKVLGLPEPAIPEVAPVERIAEEVDEALESVLAGWRTPLVDVEEERFGESAPSAWKIVYCVDAMLEHAVMHPIRHELQLRELLGSIE
ncbi:MAG: hypothetical protein KDC38_05175 [Planctomycetes bacterium]|nr:hypothetical protein [Planctomycetota bacterium]